MPLIDTNMQDWITPLVEKEFCNACLLFRSTSLARESVEGISEGRLDIGPSGVSIRIENGNIVQVIHHHGKNDITLSDGHAKIRAVLSKASTKEFKRRNGRSFSDSTLGGFLEIGNYALIFNPKSSPKKKVMFHVQDFNYLGNEGALTYNQPINVEEKTCLLEVTENLHDMCRQFIGDEMSSPVRSQTSASSPVRSNFATQPVFSTRSPGNVAKPQPVEEKTPISLPPGKVMSLLAQLASKPVKEQPAVGGGKAEDVSRRALHTLADDSSNTRKFTLLEPLRDERIDQLTTKISAKANNQYEMPAPSLQQSAGTTGVNGIIEGIGSARTTDCTLIHTGSSPPLDNERGNSQERHKNKHLATSEPEVINARADIKDQSTHDNTITFTDHTKAVDPFEGVKRVPRSYIRVPAAQRIILERKDSWIQSEVHSRSILSNIPSDILESLRAFGDRRSNEEIHKESELTRESDETGLSGHEDEADDVGDFLVEGESSKMNEASDRENESSQDKYQSRSKASLRNIASSPLGTTNEEDEEDDNHQGLSEEEGIYWSPSPEPRVDAQTLPPTFQRIGKLLSTSSTFADFSGTAIHDTPALSTQASISITQSHKSDLQKRTKSQVVRNFDFYPSSGGVEEDLEFDIPHAIGDEVQDSDSEVDGAIREPQQLPSTAINEKPLVQVEQTPLLNSRIPGTAGLASRLSSRNALLPSNQHAREDESSDSIIPATFDDTLLSDLPDYLVRKDQKTGEPGDWRQVDRPFADEEMEPEEEEDPAEQQLLEELNCSPQIEVASSPRIYNPTSYTDHPPVLVSRSSPAPSPSPVSPAQDVTKVWLNQTPTPKHNLVQISSLEDPQKDIANGQTLTVKRRFRIKAPIFGPSQDEHTSRDISEMARVNRHNFSRQVAVEVQRSPNIHINFQSKTPKPGNQVDIANTTESLKNLERIESPIPEDQRIGKLQGQPGHVHVTSKDPFSPSHQEDSIPADQMPVGTSKSMNMPLQVAALADKDAPQIDDASEYGLDTTAYRKFQATYPSYRGSQRSFTQALCYIEWLAVKDNHCPIFTLWDEFIRVLASDYVEYARDNIVTKGINKKDALTGVVFFINKSKDPQFRPLFRAGIITSSTIEKALLSLNFDQVEKARGMLLVVDASRDARGGSSTPASTVSVPYLRNQLQQGYDPTISTNRAENNQELSSKDKQVNGTHQPEKRMPLKRPFFETSSQLPAPKQPRIANTGEEPGHRTPKSNRRLPWTQTTTPQTRSPVSKIAGPKSKTTPFTPLAQSASDYQPSTERQRSDAQIGTEGSQVSPILGSPILGEIDNNVSRYLPPSTLRASPTISRRRSSAKSPTLVGPKNIQRRTETIRRPGSLSKVAGWLADPGTAKPKFEWKDFASHYAANKRKSSDFVSTPRSSFCTKRKGNTPGT